MKIINYAENNFKTSSIINVQTYLRISFSGFGNVDNAYKNTGTRQRKFKISQSLRICDEDN